MRIYHATIGDPMLIDAASGLHALASQIEAFAASSSQSAAFAAVVGDSPAPGVGSLLGLRLHKGSGQQLTISDDRWLELNASPVHIQSFATLLRQPHDGDHCHLYSTPVSLIVEEGEPWIEA
jgi:hypothetical protein